MHKHLRHIFWLIPVFLVASSATVRAQESLTGDWLLTENIYIRPPSYAKLVLKVDGGTLSGKLERTKLEGTITGNAIHFVVKPEHGDPSEYTGTISGGAISGTVEYPKAPGPLWAKGTFKATRIPQRPDGPPQRHEFVPTTFTNEFSATIKPVLTIWPGDTVHTTTLDAGGADEHGAQKWMGGNPQTGPFYIQGAMPRDMIAVHLKRIRLNRDWAISDDNLVPRVSNPSLTVTTMREKKGTIRWHLDLQRGLASPETPDENMKHFTVPVRPMLGCVAIAPGNTPVGTQDSGSVGGNLDFNELVEGTTIYFRIAQPGALLYIGDGHAIQGDGELTGNALETSMDVEFSVDVLPGRSTVTTHVESPTHWMSIGLGGSLEEAMQEATFGLVQWLDQDYKLNGSDVAQILGTSIEYRISEVADRNVGVVAKIRKDLLTGLIPAHP